MTLPPDIENRTEEIRNEVERLGAELVELSFRRAGRREILSVIADKPGGITLEDCACLNRHLGRFLGGEEAAGLPYDLEVASPGLDRPLKSEKDFRRAAGRRLRITWRTEEGRTFSETGTVAVPAEGWVELTVPRLGTTFRIPLANVLKTVREIKFK